MWPRPKPKASNRAAWFGKPVTWHHRTVEQYLDTVAAAGFVLDTFSECPPEESLFEGHADELNGASKSRSSSWSEPPPR
jgi:hypothetical protein